MIQYIIFIYNTFIYIHNICIHIYIYTYPYISRRSLSFPICPVIPTRWYLDLAAEIYWCRNQALWKPPTATSIAIFLAINHVIGTRWPIFLTIYLGTWYFLVELFGVDESAPWDFCSDGTTRNTSWKMCPPWVASDAFCTNGWKDIRVRKGDVALGWGSN